MEEIKTTGTLTRVLQNARPSDIDDYLADNAASLLAEEKPFTAYMRKTLHEKNIRQQEAFLAADISEGYGYKLIAGEKHTRRRDVILRLCLGGTFTLDEVQRALKLYGMSPLYARIPRDAVLMVAVNNKIYDTNEVDRLLAEHGQKPLYALRQEE